MQNVLVDDRRIWVDLCVSRLFHCRVSAYTVYTALSQCRDSTMANGPTTPRWVRARVAAVLLDVTISKRLGGTVRVLVVIVVTTTWCLMYPTTGHASGGAGARVRGETRSESEIVNGGGPPREIIIATETGGGAEVGTDTRRIGIGGGDEPELSTTWNIRIYRIYYTYCCQNASEHLVKVRLHGHRHIEIINSRRYTSQLIDSYECRHNLENNVAQTLHPLKQQPSSSSSAAHHPPPPSRSPRLRAPPRASSANGSWACAHGGTHSG